MMDLIVQRENIVRNHSLIDVSSNVFQCIIGNDGNLKISLLRQISEKLDLIGYENFERFNLSTWEVADLRKFFGMLRDTISISLEGKRMEPEQYSCYGFIRILLDSMLMILLII